ncbi:hypothetical protein MGN70_009075 [Eutypa lata]|nr:hypothetical protein MGN70_009075 [Eutypa lata]
MGTNETNSPPPSPPPSRPQSPRKPPPSPPASPRRDLEEPETETGELLLLKPSIAVNDLGICGKQQQGKGKEDDFFDIMKQME